VCRGVHYLARLPALASAAAAARRPARRLIAAPIRDGHTPPRSRFMDEIDKDQRTWATIAHLSAFAYYVTGIGHILGPLIIWLAKRDGHPFVDDQAKEALNFQISITLYGIAAFILCFTVIFAVIGMPVLIGLHLFQIVCMIIAAIKAN